MKTLRRAGQTALVVAALCAFLTGCGLIPEPSVRMVTDRAEMAAYVDRFNALQSDVRVELAWREAPFQSVLDGVQADLVVGEWLSSPAVMDRFDPLGDLVKPGRVDPSWFYAGLLCHGLPRQQDSSRPDLLQPSRNRVLQACHAGRAFQHVHAAGYASVPLSRFQRPSQVRRLYRHGILTVLEPELH